MAEMIAQFAQTDQKKAARKYLRAAFSIATSA